MILPKDSMPEGLVNFRDIAALPRHRGYRLRSECFYRADNLGNLTVRGVQRLGELGIRTVIDLRRSAEAERYPSRPDPNTGIGYEHIDVVGDAPDVRSKGDTLTGVSLEERNSDGSFRYPVERLVAIYCYILDRRSREIRDVLLALTERGRQPAVFHCVAGQDRTGIVAALLLSAASVPNDVISEDYAATAEHNIDQYLAFDLPRKTGLPIYDAESYRRQLCPPQAMLKTLAHVERRYGGAIGYMETIGLPQEQIRVLTDNLLADGENHTEELGAGELPEKLSARPAPR